MRAHDILGHVDLDRISAKLLRQLQDVIDREAKRPIDLAVLGLMYGQASAEIEIEQAKAELAKTKADTERLQAAAAKDRAKAANSSR